MRYILILTFLITTSLIGQNQINVFKNYTTVLIFESDIENIINGNDLEYIVEKNENSFSANRTLTIKIQPEARTEKGTNVIVFTKDGMIYHFDLMYKKPTKLIHHITPKIAHSSLPTDNRTSNNSTENNIQTVEKYNSKGKSIGSSKESKDEMNRVISNCEKTLKRRKRIFQKLDKSYNVSLSLKEIAYSGDKLYMYFDIKNKGGQAYDVEYMHFFKSTSEDDKNITSQKDRLPIYYTHNQPTRIDGKKKHTFITVIEKTSINENKAILIRIKEKGGERDLNLNINDQIVNNPVKL